MSDFTLDLREFRKGLADVASEEKREMPDILNKAVLTALIGGSGVQGAIQRTPVANLVGLDRQKVAVAVAQKLRYRGIKMTRGAGAARDSRGRITGYSRRTVGITKAEFDALVDQEMSRRARSVGYTARSGWANAVNDFGGIGAQKQSGFYRSKAALGFGHKATTDNLIAEIENAAPWAVEIGEQPLQDAFDAVGVEMQRHHAEKMQNLFDRHIPK